jgi:mono/diheme cytochrome c family protein
MNALLAAALALAQTQAPPTDPPAYADVQEIFRRHCVGCHNAKEQKGALILESYETLKRGGENGDAFVPGKPDESLLVRLVEFKARPYMPPPKKGRKLEPAEIEILRAWIAAGAPPPRPGELARRAAAAPRILPKGPPRRPVFALAYEPRARLLAVARPGEVEIRSAESRGVLRRLEGHAGAVHGLAFSADGALLAAASGSPGASGEVVLWNPADGTRRRELRGHADAVYAVALSPDGKILATGSYDHKILLWDVTAGSLLKELEGHNEAVFDLAFRPDGRILASASGDRTVKLWDVATGRRKDTLTESTKALHAVAFSPDGGHVAAAGVDNRVRVWRVSPDAAEGTNEIVHSTFAHEGALLRIAYSRDGKLLATSADDRTVKLWNAAGMTPRAALEPQPDWPSALAFARDDQALVVGRLDGSLGFYSTADGKVLPMPKPELASIEPRGLRRGEAVRARLAGKNLAGVLEIRVHGAGLRATLLPEGGPEVVWAELAAAPDARPGPVELSVRTEGGESGRLAVHLDDLPQVPEREPNDTPSQATSAPLPASFWGTLAHRPDADCFSFEGRAGEQIVFDVAARRLGSKAEIVLTVSDASGRVLASNVDFEGEADPLVALTLPTDGRYTARVADLQMGGSPEHFYRLSIGRLPLATACHPLAVPAGRESRVRLVGYNLPPDASVAISPTGPGDWDLPVDPARIRIRRALKVLATEGPEAVEAEDNDAPDRAMPLPAPGAVSGRFDRAGDADLYRFEARRGQRWVIETQAAQRGSPADTRVEILDAAGKPVPRVLLRAVRDSYITFRAVASDARGARLWQWEEMDLDQYLYMQGEVVRLFRAPRGPDSEWDFYALGGKRIAYFDTSPTAHALDEPCYVVEPHPPGATFPPNGLPAFTINYGNDDDALRALGTDSRVHFTAPDDGAYLVRVTETRGFWGDRYVYRLIVREARPDFRVRVEGVDARVPAGSGRAFTVHVDRIDGFEGPVRVDVEDVPPGFRVSTPLVIEAGHFQAEGTIFAEAGAPAPPAGRPKLTARALVEGREAVRDAGTLGALARTTPPKVRVFLEPEGGPGDEIVVEPGKLVPARLRIERLDFGDRVTFEVENLPHGVIVADIGLNGVLIPEGQTERKIFLQCAPWVAPTERPAFARAREVGNPTSRPITVRVSARR